MPLNNLNTITLWKGVIFNNTSKNTNYKKRFSGVFRAVVHYRQQWRHPAARDGRREGPGYHRHARWGSLLGSVYEWFLCTSRDVRKLARRNYRLWHKVKRTGRNDLHENWGQGHGERIWQDNTSPSNMHQGNRWTDSCGMSKLRLFRNI